jgi:hypothetical protein
VDPQALAAAWLEQLRSPAAGALSPPIRIQYREEKCPSDPPPRPSPPPRPWPLARSLAIPWRSRPPAPPGFAPVAAAAAC